MPRMKIDIPPHVAFHTDIPVRISDVNYGGHVGNDSILSIVHEARVRFFLNHGWTELDAGGASIIMADAAVVYRSEAFYGETLAIDISVGEIGRSSCDLFYRITEKDSGREVARVRTGIVFFDYTKRKVAEMPEAFRSAFTGINA